MGELITSTLPAVLPELHPESTEGLGSGGYIVTVFNNDHNTYDEVMHILMIATGCDPEEAFIETWEIDHLGQSVVHQSSESECHRVAGVIATIGIKVSVSKG